MLIYYSLGNFVTGQETLKQLLGGMAAFTIQKTVDGDQTSIQIQDATLTPLVMHYSYDTPEYAPYKLDDYTDALASAHSVRQSIGDEFSLENLQTKYDEIMSMNVTPSTKTDLLDVIEECKERLQESADRKEIKIEVEGSPLVFETTKTILEEVVYNLMDNAIKYNREQGNVTVRIFRKEKQFGFSVKDTGIGIPLIHQDRIFERFYRVDKSRSKEIGGTGLGLSIVKHGVSCLGAQISVDSIPDEGSTFTVTWG